MKNNSTICLILSLLLFCSKALNQKYNYVPFPDSGALWSEIYYSPIFSGDIPNLERFALNGEDTVLNDTTYTMLYIFYDTNFNKKQSLYSNPIAQCPNFNSESQIKFSVVPVVFKGNGWYVNDYAKKSNSSTSKPAPEQTSSTKSDSKNNTKSQTSENKNKESKSTKN